MTYPNFELIEYITKEKVKEFYPDFYKKIKCIDCKMDCFVQTWSTTALGFDANGGLSGQAFTDAYTTVAIIEYHEDVIVTVFFNNEIAYMFMNPSSTFYTDLRHRNMKSQKESWVYFGDGT